MECVKLSVVFFKHWMMDGVPTLVFKCNNNVPLSELHSIVQSVAVH